MRRQPCLRGVIGDDQGSAAGGSPEVRPQTGKTERYERDHGKILRAIECRDGKLAQSIMAQHLGKLEQEFIQAEKR